MLPHAFEPQRVDVAVEHTPEKVGRQDIQIRCGADGDALFEGLHLAVVTPHST